MTRRATVNGKTFRVRLAADVYVRSTGFKNMVVIFDDEALLYNHPQEGRWPHRTREVMVPLDIVFLDRNFVIVDIESMLIELVGTPDSELLVYRPSAPATYVIQIKGGLSDASSIFVGDHVAIR